MPSCTACRPSTTTCSPGFSPSSMTQSESTRGPTFTFLNVDLAVRADDGHAVEVLQFLHGALRHEQRAGLACRASTPARARTGPAAGRSADWGRGTGCPACRWWRPPRARSVRSFPSRIHRAVGEPRARCPAPLRLLAALRGIAPDDAQVVGFGDADAENDRIDLRTPSSAAWPRRARRGCPALTRVVPTRPSIGETTRVYPRSSVALSTAASPRPPATAPRPARRRALSSSCWLTACLARAACSA